ncbi:MAG: hypothetical protein Q9227_002960 [Pyrenula ochraceoflavens]
MSFDTHSRRTKIGVSSRTSPEAAKIYRLLQHYSLQGFEAAEKKRGRNKSMSNSDNVPFLRSWASGKRQDASFVGGINPKLTVPASEEQSPLYEQTRNILFGRWQELADLKEDLWRFYNNIVPEDRFFFEVRRRELESCLEQCIQWISTFTYHDETARRWDEVLQELCANGDERILLQATFEYFLHSEKQMQLIEICDLDAKLKARLRSLDLRIQEYENDSIKIELYSQGCQVVEAFLTESQKVMSLVETNISKPGGAEDLPWFRESMSGRIRFAPASY